MTLRAVLRDPSLPHQVVLTNRRSSLGIFVSCNCRYTRNAEGRFDHDPIGKIKDYPETARLYNDPANHYIKFGPEDRIRIG